MQEEVDTYHSLSARTRPKLNRLLSALSLNQQFVRGEGGSLFYFDKHENEVRVSDYVGGYGSLLLGHHHPDLRQKAIELLNEQVPFHTQLSSKPSVNALAQFISDELGSYSGKKYITTLANSGAEAVEAALKHARLNFSKNKEKLLDRLYRELHAINHFFATNEPLFEVRVDGRQFSDFEAFKTYCIGHVQEVFNEQSPVVLALNHSFHGKTTGALNLTSNEQFRNGFQTNDGEKAQVVFVPPSTDHIESALLSLFKRLRFPKLTNGTVHFEESSALMCLGVIVEPIQGEGGIRPVPYELLSFLRERTKNLNIPLIFDEIQCGSFRTGTFAHSLQEGIYADYYLFSKSFGGGMVKNAALVIDEKHYHEGFGVVHTSTYSDDAYSAEISLKALHIAKSAQEAIRTKGNLLKDCLHRIQNNYPEVVKEVRGAGLMWGIEFYDLDFSTNYSFQMFSRSGYLNYLYCSYLLNKWNIRLAPTLSDPHTLRILPSIFMTDHERSVFEAALEALASIIHCRDFYKLVEHLLPEEEQNLRPLTDFGRGNVIVEIDENVEHSVGFISHYINENGVKEGDPSMTVLSNDTINTLLESVLEISAPILLHGRKISGTTGKSVNTYFAGMLFTASMAREMMNKHLFAQYDELCNDAVDFLHNAFNCSLVGLGQYSSVITKNGKSIRNPHVFVTTGNSYTVGIGVQAIKEEISARILEGKPLTLGVLGAAGNICSTYVKCFLPYFSKLVLKGSDSKAGKLKTLRFLRELIHYVLSEMRTNPDARTSSIHPTTYDLFAESTTYHLLMSEQLMLNDASIAEQLMTELGDAFPFHVIDSLEELVQCDVTVVATNHPEPFLYSHYFADNSIVYDISVPVNSSDELIHNERNIKVIMGGVVELPFEQTITMRAYPLGKGEAFACISETILLGLEDKRCNFSYGNLYPSQVHYMNQLGAKHGFKLKKNKLETIF